MRVYFLLSFLILLVSCRPDRSSVAAEFVEEVYSPRYASGFCLKGAPGRESVLISTFNSWQGADSVATELFIARGGEVPPVGFDGQVLRGAAERVVTMSSTQIAMLDALGVVDRVVGVSGLDFVSNDFICSHRAAIGDVGYDGNINYEVLMSLDPDIVLLYGVNGANEMEGKLRELGIPFMYVGDYLEESPLGKAEWIVALAEVVGLRSAGVEVFSEIPVNYDRLKQLVNASVSLAPSVMLNSPYGDAWFMPSADSYMARLVADAGGDYVYKRNTGNASLPIDMEEAFSLVSDCDFWLNVGTLGSLSEVAQDCPKLVNARCFREGRVFNNNARTTPGGGNDFFESAIVHPDLVLRDLVKIFHPDLVREDFVYYHQLR